MGGIPSLLIGAGAGKTMNCMSGGSPVGEEGAESPARGVEGEGAGEVGGGGAGVVPISPASSQKVAILILLSFYPKPPPQKHGAMEAGLLPLLTAFYLGFRWSEVKEAYALVLSSSGRQRGVVSCLVSDVAG